MASTHSSGRAAPDGRELRCTPEEALQLAIERHRLGEFDAAETIYTALLERWPDHADVLSHMGILQHQRGDHRRALALLRHAAQISPGAAGIWNNLGNVLVRLQQSDEAERAFRRSIELADSPEAQSNLASMLRRRKQWQEAETACRRALELVPGFGDAWHNLSLVMLGQGRAAEATRAAKEALRLLPAQRRQRDSFTRALVRAGEVERAATMLREWLAEEPDNPYVQHHLAACSGESAPGRASDAYVEHVFDDFASSFDAKLARLSYRAPQLVADALGASLPAPAHQYDIADIGCGTGLCGPLIRRWARRLWGCDLSAAMLAQAERRALYDELEKAELLQFMLAHPDGFDVVVSADTLCYFGALAGVAQAARRALRAGGQIVFTVEALPEGDESGFRLQANGRYAHGLAYLRSVLDGAGFDPLRIAAEVLRSESGLPVQGWLVTASRTAIE